MSISTFFIVSKEVNAAMQDSYYIGHMDYNIIIGMIQLLDLHDIMLNN